MNSKVLAAFSILLTLAMVFASGLILDAYLRDIDDVSLLILFVLFLLVTLVMIYTIAVDIIIGRKTIIFQKDEIIIGRNKKETYNISRCDVSDVTFTYDSYNKDRCILSFCYKKKKYYLSVKKHNKRVIEDFFADVNYNKKNDSLVYLMQCIIEVFS